MRIQYRFIYKQKFMGKILQDSFVKAIYSYAEIEDTINALYSDPHVFEVRHEKVGHGFKE